MTCSGAVLSTSSPKARCDESANPSSSHAGLPGVALQQQQPRGLNQGVEGDPLVPGKLAQALGTLCIQADLMLGLPVALGFGPEGLGQPRRLVQFRRTLAPEALAGGLVLALQPLDIVAVTAVLACRGDTGVTLQHLAEQARAAPAIEQDMVVGQHQLVLLFGAADHRQAQQRTAGQVETATQVGLGPFLQRPRQVGLITPVELDQRQPRLALHHLQ
ncbi:hypothetical protein WR25_14688 [Diploscapter pachys]|uniref:Uncharacterized protein n=1 Tax=Diploscapter pachys TaxID=2018661 RepID=A0A2A2K1S4_9BILA|nr:hypothetical protein WR25_14688 [Diploscapter pachys]